MIKERINSLKNDYNQRTLFFTFNSAIINFAYSIYNGVLGTLNKSIWNGSICVYYLFLLIIKLFLTIQNNKTNSGKQERKIIYISFILLFFTAITMIAPAISLIKNERTYSLGLIAAISMATYTTYSITMAIINLRKAKKRDNELIKQIRLINIISALMSIIVLQNTLILATSGMNEKMIILSSWSTLGIIGIIILLISINFYKYLKVAK